MQYALKQYLYDVEKVDENGDVFLVNQIGDKTFMTEKEFADSCIPVKVVEKKRILQKSPFELAAIAEGYNCLNNSIEDEEYIVGTLNISKNKYINKL